MAHLLDVIKYEGDNSTFIWKHPKEDFNIHSQLIVHESQEAIFFLNGQALDTFGPGRYDLETQNMPFLTKHFSKLSKGETAFHCEVYFINQTVQMAFKWGTPELVSFIEPTLGVPLAVGASGEMNLQVCDSRKLLIKLVGTMRGIAWGDGAGFTKSLQDSFRPLITTAVKTHLPTTIKDNKIDLFDIDQSLESLSKILRENIAPGFEEYGLTIPQFYVTRINLPEEDLRYKESFKKLRELHTVTLQKRFIEAEASVKAAERERILEEEANKTVVARAQAERAKIAGFAEAEIMHAQGYNQKDVIQSEVQKEYAKGIGNMTINGGAGGVVGDMVGMGVGLAAMGQLAPQMSSMLGGMKPQEASAPTEKIKCSSCGAEVSAGSKFCNECGAKIVLENEIICPSCGAKTVKGKFCSECGAPFVRKCQCGAEVPSGSKFCPECGEKQ